MSKNDDTFDLEDDDDYVPYVPIKQRREAKFQKLVSQRRLPEQQNLAEADEGIEDSHKAGPKPISQKTKKCWRTEAEKNLKEEKVIMEVVAQKNHLASDRELAKGIIYTNLSRLCIWRSPRHILEAHQREHNAIRQSYHILVDGYEFPPAILKCLKSKGINRHTPIQVQGLPVVLFGLDMIGIAFTGSVKTLAFSLTLIIFDSEEIKLPLIRGESPIGMIVCPSVKSLI
ncbi:hypothetical protein C2G38_2242683 [Gigaspora rosea]|uniref:P-loop containing nucleoside triphosphate hydrolase protein n=1 Tax=Gigaspora rosea TaxID=44941 RepID=A0A397VWT5_9GLOM|nr:hypothetical protein C2G38_2242683 [Gigaspora rosea]